MAAHEESTTPLKVFLWTTPRSCSTAFLKCMTSVPDTVAWHEPYLQMGKFSLDKDPLFAGPANELLEKQGGTIALENIESGYKASDKSLDWLKEQLEGDFPGKKLVFVKEIGASIVRQALFDKIPKGFRHTFLICHPRKIAMSLMKAFVTLQASGRLRNHNMTSDKIRPNQYLNELWKHVKSDIEARPLIIDIDEFLENPEKMLEAYCKAVGIPFSDDLLTWEAGDEVMTKQWMVPKETILTYRAVGAHDGTFASTGFQKRPNKLPENLNQINLKIPPQILEVMNEIEKREVPYYEELYLARFQI